MSQYLFLLTAVLGTVSAIFTGAVTHIKAPSQLKALVLAVFSLASGAVEQTAQHLGHFTWPGFATASVAAFFAGVVAHKSSLIAFITGPGGLLAKYVPGGLGTPAPAAVPVAKQGGAIAAGGVIGALVVITLVLAILWLIGHPARIG